MFTSVRIAAIVGICLAGMAQAATGGAAGDTKGKRVTRILDNVEGFKEQTFESVRIWPPANADLLSPFCVDRDALAADAVAEWKGQEDWLRTMRQLVLRNATDEAPEVWWLQNWPNDGDRCVYAVWNPDGFRYAGRRDFGRGACCFAVLPNDETGLQFAGTLESAQQVLNRLLSERCALSLEPLKTPRTIPVFDGRETVHRTFKTAILSEEKVENVLFLTYWPETVGQISLMVSVWLGPDALAVRIQDPVVPSGMSGRLGKLSLSPPPDSLKALIGG